MKTHLISLKNTLEEIYAKHGLDFLVVIEDDLSGERDCLKCLWEMQCDWVQDDNCKFIADIRGDKNGEIED